MSAGENPPNAQPPFRLGYNTNGLPFHRLDEALTLIAELGYGAVAITPDVGQLDPFRTSPSEVRRIRDLIEALELTVAVETGARFVLNPRRKHRPTLLESSRDERNRRVDYYRRMIDLASSLGGSVVSIWSGAVPEGASGTLDDDPGHPLGDVLAEGLVDVLAHAEPQGITVAFEPEPGMFIERPVGFSALKELMGGAGDALGMTLDVGHCVVTDDLPVSAMVARYREHLVHVHLADCPAGEHVHVPLGDGALDLRDALSGLMAVGYSGMAAVELSRDGHRGPEAASDSIRALRAALIAHSP